LCGRILRNSTRADRAVRRRKRDEPHPASKCNIFEPRTRRNPPRWSNHEGGTRSVAWQPPADGSGRSRACPATQLPGVDECGEEDVLSAARSLETGNEAMMANPKRGAMARHERRGSRCLVSSFTSFGEGVSSRLWIHVVDPRVHARPRGGDSRESRNQGAWWRNDSILANGVARPESSDDHHVECPRHELKGFMPLGRWHGVSRTAECTSMVVPLGTAKWRPCGSRNAWSRLRGRR
jgi:hypothetical protein